MDQIQFIPFDKLVESKTNPRRHFDNKGIGELAASIKAKGIINPILVRPVPLTGGERFEIVAGARRYRASKAAGIETIPAFVRQLTDDEVLEIQVIENLQREDVHPLDEAIGYRQLLDKKIYTTASIASKVGKSQGYVEQRLRLTYLIEPARKAFWENKFTVSHAILIARLQPKDQARVLTFALKTWQEFDGDHEYHNPLNPDILSEDKPQGYGELEAQTVCSVKDLNDFIQKRILLDLKQAAFDKKDDKLVPKAGSCLDCPKRSGFSKELFNDITQADICTDPGCFAAKQEAHLIQLKTTFKKEKKKFIEVTQDQRKPEGHSGAITERSFKKVAEGSCKFTRVGIYIDGSNKGKTVTICAAKKECKKHWSGYKSNRMSYNDGGDSSSEPRSAALSPQKQIERLQNKIAEAAESMAEEIISETIPDLITSEISHDDLVMGFNAFRWYWTYQAIKKMKLKGKPENWKTKDLTRAVKLASYYYFTENRNADSDDLRAIAKRLKIDIAAIEKQARIDVEKECKDDMKQIEKLKAELAAKDKSKELKSGVCRICGCIDDKPCLLKSDGSSPYYCSWTDKTKTLCSNPKCVKAAAAEEKPKPKPAAKKKSRKTAKAKK